MKNKTLKMNHRPGCLSLLSYYGSVTTLHKFGITSPNKLFYSSSSTLSPVATYDNFELHKDRILKENKNKSGVYRLTNLDNQKSYIGSSVDLRKRFHVYYSISRLSLSNMAIYKALLKYGHSKFSLEILEYCEPDKAVSKEQEYLDLLKPCYNLNPMAGSSLGYKHSEEALAKLSANMIARMTGRTVSDETRANLSAAATGRVLTAEERAKISVARTGMKFTDEHRSKISVAMSAINGVAVIVTNIETGDIKEFATMTAAGAALGVSRTAIKKAIQSGKVFRDSYIINLKNQL